MLCEFQYIVRYATPWHEPTRWSGNHESDELRGTFAQANVQRPVVSVQVHTIKGQVLCDPMSYFDHVFIFNDEVNCRAQSITYGFPFFIALVASVLIKFWRNSGTDLCA